MLVEINFHPLHIVKKMLKYLVLVMFFAAAFADKMFDMSLPKRGIETERDRTLGKLKVFITEANKIKCCVFIFS